MRFCVKRHESAFYFVHRRTTKARLIPLRRSKQYPCHLIYNPSEVVALVLRHKSSLYYLLVFS